MSSKHVRKGQHFTKLTVSSARWCNKCRKMTQHRVDGGRPGGPCLDCMEPEAAKLAASRSINSAVSSIWPMPCFCRAWIFAHHHPDGFVYEYYPGPWVVAEFEAKHGLRPIAEMQKLVASSQQPGASA